MIIIDRIIDTIAVCVADDVLLEIPLSNINGDVREGDVLRPDGERYIVDSEETCKRRLMISERFDRIKARRKNQEE